jgi:DsbC/DsbD-like thiol-disulfide interchange protein
MQLAKGWHTYWKYPGVNGSPPALKIISQTNLASLNFTWPFPKILGPSNYKYLGYDKSLLIPFEIIKLNKNMDAQVSIEFSYGICKTICLVKKTVLNIQEEKSSKIEGLEKIYLAFSQKPSILKGAPDSTCSLKSTGTNTFELNITNKVLYENKNVDLVLVDNNNKKYSLDYQYFNSQTGIIKADVYSEDRALTEFELEKVNILLLINGLPKKIIGCKS